MISDSAFAPRRLSMASVAGAVVVLLAASTVAAQQPQQTAPSQPAQAPAAAPPKAPLPNRFNEVLPSWLQLRGEFRERVEGFASAGFVESRDDLYYLSRFRFNATLAPARHLALQIQAQDARVGRKTVAPAGAPFRAPFDLRQAFAEVGDAKAPVTLRLGRQELVFGEQRLVGHVSWLNAARSFDAARVIWRAPAFQVDAFAASLVRILDGFDRSGNGNRFAGAYVTAPQLIPLASVEPYIFFRKDANQRPELGAPGSLAQTTVGTRLAGRLPARFDYGVEMAAQRGSLADDRIDAWAGHWQLRRRFPGTRAVRLTGEYNYATGDANATDGTRRTFDQLYPTPHDKLGLADQVGWRNIHHLRAIVDVTPVRALPLSFSYHSFWLADAADGLYGASGAQVARVAGGAASTHVGHELDVQVTRAITPQIEMAAGYSHLFTGDFLKQATPGASYSQPYVMVTYVFLAER